jgi:acetyl-CoA C-acetyltransferase
MVSPAVTSTSPDRTPVVVAAGQVCERGEPLDVLELIVRAAEEALARAPLLRAAVQRVSVVGVLSPAGPALASAVAARLGIEPGSCEVSTIGGNSPQSLVTRAAAEIAAGRLSATLVAGGEALRSARMGVTAPPPATIGPADPVYGSRRIGVGDAERAAGLGAPVHVYAMIESAIAARLGRPPAEHRLALAELFAPFTEVAAGHPQAWFREVRSPAEIAEPTEENRLVSDPYTKRMCAFLGSDQAAALLVCSLAAAREAKVADRAVFVWSGASCDDVWEPVARPDFAVSPGLAAAARAALAAAGVGAAEVSSFDLYSCFPAAVEIAADALGLPPGDGRGLTVTGGLPYFGGPGNNYSTHAIATMTDELRVRGEGTGLVGALGWYLTKHAYGLYGAAPPPRGFRLADTSGEQAAIDATALPVTVAGREEADGTVVAGTVTYRDASPASAPAVLLLDDGRRTAANAVDEDLAELAGTTLVGRRARLVAGTAAYTVVG